MATGLGFCPSCGTPRVAAEQKFCPTCGAALAAISASAPIAPVPVDAAPQWVAPAPVDAVEATPPPPPAWAAPAAVTPPPATPADFAPAPPPWAAPAPIAPPPAPPMDYAPPPPPSWGAPAGQGYPPAPPQYSAAPVGPTQTRSRTSPALLLVGLLLIVGIVAGGYYFLGNNKGTPGSSSNPTVGPGGTSSALSTPGGNGGGNDGGLTGAANNFANIQSYKFSMTLAGGQFGDMLSLLGGSSGSGGAPFTMSGSVTTNPSAADINIGGIHMVEIGGYDYMDISGTGTFFKTPQSGSSMAQSLSPATMFSSAMDTSAGSGFSKVGTDTKNGVKADHYTASSSALAAYGSSLGVAADATWSADVWIAQNGGYPVSMSIIATASDKTVAYQVTFDISNVNDPSIKITAPANVSGT